jgi:hypothetical protein
MNSAPGGGQFAGSDVSFRRLFVGDEKTPADSFRVADDSPRTSFFRFPQPRFLASDLAALAGFGGLFHLSYLFLD